jgi:predicted dehydrogenase
MKASEITGIKVVPVAFCDYFRRKAVATAYKYNKNAAIYYDADGYKKMMADPNVHAVILATPPNFRPLHFEAAVKAKKHVFEEKPVAVDPEGCRRHFIAAEIALSNNLTVVAGT